jgi:hypothetical protein
LKRRSRLLDAATLFLSILPSRFGTAYQELGGFLTRRFAELEPDAPLADLVPVTEKELPRIAASRLQQLASDRVKDRQVEQVLDRIRRSSAWRILQSVGRLLGRQQVAQTASLPPKARAVATQRMRTGTDALACNRRRLDRPPHGVRHRGPRPAKRP